MEQNLHWSGETRRLGPGVGFNWFDYLGMGGSYAHPPEYYPLGDPCYPDLGDTASWEALLNELTRLRPGFLRFGLPPDPHLDEHGRLITESVHLERLTRVARWAEAHGCTILLDTFLLPTRHEMRTPEDGSFRFEGMYQLAARDNRAYAREFVAPFLHHLVVERGLAAVRYFNPVNEPLCYGVYQTPNNEPDAYVHYVAMYREIREALDAIGLPRERLGLVGADCVEAENFPALEMLARGVDLDPYVDAYTLHYYLLRFDYLPPRPAVCGTIPMSEGMDKHTEKIARYCAKRGKPLWAGEVGSFYYGWRLGDPSGPTTFDATLTVAEAVIRGMNLGLGAFAFWSLLNPNTVDGHWAILQAAGGTVTGLGHPHAVYGLLAQSGQAGSEVYPLNTAKSPEDLAYVHGTVLRHPSGERHLLVVNDHPTEAIDVMLRAPGGDDWSAALGLLLTRDGAAQFPAPAGGRFTLPAFSLVRFSLPV